MPTCADHGHQAAPTPRPQHPLRAIQSVGGHQHTLTNLAETYRRKVAELVAALEAGDGAEARELVRGLVERVTLHPEGDGQRVEVRGELAAILSLAQGAKRAGGGVGSVAVLCEQIKLVAGAGYHLYRTRLRFHC